MSLVFLKLAGVGGMSYQKLTACFGCAVEGAGPIAGVGMAGTAVPASCPGASRAAADTDRGRGLCHLQKRTSSTARRSQWLEWRLAIQWRVREHRLWPGQTWVTPLQILENRGPRRGELEKGLLQGQGSSGYVG